ncbi:MAG: hypothetical protein Q8O67_08985 [Deltaproteobacteria bacterium]|nr:hypothetical protein [Deltaproteobacteria bacterium]
MPTAVVVVVVVALGACADEGQLDQTPLVRPCVEGDVACAAPGLPGPLAVGASQTLAALIDVDGSLAPRRRYVSANDAVLTVEGPALIGQYPGTTAVLIQDGDVVLDFFHIGVEAPEVLTLHRRIPSGAIDPNPMPPSFDVFAGEEFPLRFSLWGGAADLSGEVGDEWTLDDDRFELLQRGAPRERVLRAPDVAGATATLTVTALGFTQSISFRAVESSTP